MSIESHWDRNSKLRYDQQISGKDITFSYVFLPLWEEYVQSLLLEERNDVVEIGCGTGVLSGHLSRYFKKLTCLEPSIGMYEVATEYCKNHENVSIVPTKLENYSTTHGHSLCYAHMVFHNIEDITGAFAHASKIIRPGGTLAFVIPHPCFFNFYRANDLTDFRYNIHQKYEIPFRISLETEALPQAINYFHRPLSDYINSLSMNGFFIEEVIEPFPEADVMTLYPEPWTFPRYMFVACRKL